MKQLFKKIQSFNDSHVHQLFLSVYPDAPENSSDTNQDVFMNTKLYNIIGEQQDFIKNNTTNIEALVELEVENSLTSRVAQLSPILENVESLND